MKHVTDRKGQPMNFDPNQIVQTLTASIRLALPPIAICFTDKVPAGIRNWAGRVPAAAGSGRKRQPKCLPPPRVITTCARSARLRIIWRPPKRTMPRRDALRVFADLGYVREQDIALIPVLESRSSHVIYGPLATIPLAADQMLFLSEASQQVEGGLPPAMGRPACAIVPQAKNTGRAALSLGCCGARAYLDVLTDDVALWAIPGSKLDLYAERIAVLAKANAVLATFHQVRRKDVEDGKSPTIKESLAAMASRN